MSLHSLPHADTAQAVPSVPVHQATDLTADGQIAYIQLDDKNYVLRITRQGKLILTK